MRQAVRAEPARARQRTKGMSEPLPAGDAPPEAESGEFMFKTGNAPREKLSGLELEMTGRHRSPAARPVSAGDVAAVGELPSTCAPKGRVPVTGSVNVTGAGEPGSGSPPRPPGERTASAAAQRARSARAQRIRELANGAVNVTGPAVTAATWAGLAATHPDWWFTTYHPGSRQHDALARTAALGLLPFVTTAPGRVTADKTGRITRTSDGAFVPLSGSARHAAFLRWLTAAPG